MRTRGLIDWRRNERAYRSLVICFLFSLVTLIPYIVKPDALTPVSPVYGGLMVVLIVVNAVALRVFDKMPCVAVQFYWWCALVVVSVMTAVDAARHFSELPMPPPMIVAIPALATILIRMFVSWRASIVYGVGALALVIPTGMVYQDIGQPIALVGIVILAVTIGGRKRESATTLHGATKALEADNARLTNAIKRLKRRE